MSGGEFAVKSLQTCQITGSENRSSVSRRSSSSKLKSFWSWGWKGNRVESAISGRVAAPVEAATPRGVGFDGGVVGFFLGFGERGEKN